MLAQWLNNSVNSTNPPPWNVYYELIKHELPIDKGKPETVHSEVIAEVVEDAQLDILIKLKIVKPFSKYPISVRTIRMEFVDDF